jgi:colicin import membrane protein
MAVQEVNATVSTDLAEFDVLLATVTQAMRPVLGMKVTDAGTEREAQSAASQIRTFSKRVDTRVKELCAPLKAQMDAIKAAGDRVKSVMGPADQHVTLQLTSYARELERKRQEEARIHREKVEAERRAAEEKRRAEEEALRARQAQERREREAAAEADRLRIAQEAEARRKAAEEEARAQQEAASLFGTPEPSPAERLVAETQARLEAEAAQRAADAKAEAEARDLAEQQERERIADEARRQREQQEREQALEFERKMIESQRVKGARKDYDIEVVDPWIVPREFLRDPDVKLAEVKAAVKQGRTEIPGLKITEKVTVAIRSQPVPSMGVV